MLPVLVRARSPAAVKAEAAVIPAAVTLKLPLGFKLGKFTELFVKITVKFAKLLRLVKLVGRLAVASVF